MLFISQLMMLYILIPFLLHNYKSTELVYKGKNIKIVSLSKYSWPWLWFNFLPLVTAFLKIAALLAMPHRHLGVHRYYNKEYHQNLLTVIWAWSSLEHNRSHSNFFSYLLIDILCLCYYTYNIIYLYLYNIHNYILCFSGRWEEVCVSRVLKALHAKRPPGQAHKDASEERQRWCSGGKRGHLRLLR